LKGEHRIDGAGRGQSVVKSHVFAILLPIWRAKADHPRAAGNRSRQREKWIVSPRKAFT
jgi:hypothetical protein